MGKFHNMFINDQANQRCNLDDPLFLLFDGVVNDIVTIAPVLERVGEAFSKGDSDYKNVIVFAHGFSENCLTQLAVNFVNSSTINVVPMVTPLAAFANSQLQFMMDLSAFTGAKIFGLKDRVSEAQMSDLGKNMKNFEAYRFRSTIVGDPDSVNVEVRVGDLQTQKEAAASQSESLWIEERLGKITGGIAKLTIYGGSNGELKEAHDRCEDAVCAVRSAISKGAVPGGCRVYINLATSLAESIEEGQENGIVQEILIPSLMTPVFRLLENAGYDDQQQTNIIDHLIDNEHDVYDVENQKFGTAEDLGIFDALPAVEEALKNAASIASVMGTLGGIVSYPRDSQFEREEAGADMEFQRTIDNAGSIRNEANERINVSR
jgi:chaperonin GroEL